jgi:hypothetical protein
MQQEKKMKTGKSIVELAQELTRIKKTARDFVVPTSKLYAEPAEGGVTLNFKNGVDHSYSLNQWSRAQVANYTKIPREYFERLSTETPDLLAKNINHGLEKSAARYGNESRMLRTLDGRVRGMLSSRYRILDSHDLLEAIFPVLSDKGMEIVSSEITDRRLFIKALSPRITADVSKGDTVQYGLVISTSDVGAGSVRVEPLVYRLVCQNGMISNTAIRKFHVGKNQAEDDIRELLTDKTRELTDAAFWAQVRDVVLSSMKAENFERQVDRIRIAAGERITNFDLPRVVELSMNAVKVSGDSKKNSILAALASGNEGAGLTKWGLINSFTRAAQQDEFDYEESVELERAAGQILEIPAKQWSYIANVQRVS